MGELRKKIGMSFIQRLNFVLIILLSFALACILQYRLFEKTVKTDIDMYIQYLAYFLFLMAFVVFIIFYLKNKAIVPINLYQNGIVFKRRSETVMYSDIPTFYFIPSFEQKIKYLILEKGNGGRILVEIDYAGEDFADYFQKDYIAANTNKALEKIRNGSDLMFGMLSKKQNLVLKVFKGKNMVRKLEFEDKFYISKDTLKYKDFEYNWSMIDIDYDIQNGNIEIKDKNNNTIISTYFSYVEKGEFAFNLMDCLIEEAQSNNNKLLIEYDDNQEYISDNIQEDIKTEYEIENCNN